MSTSLRAPTVTARASVDGSIAPRAVIWI